MIQIENLQKSFGKLPVLNRLNLTLEAGKCYALIGPNGCGKTTLIKSILGMVLPDAGSIHVFDQSVNEGPAYREMIGYMPQIGKFPGHWSIGQLFDLMIHLRKHKGETDKELFNAFKLNELSEKKLGTLSGGTIQKVSACLAYLFQPKIVILDEPTAGLDPVSSIRLKEKIKSATPDTLTLITSHILSELEELATDVLYMHEGNLLFQGTQSALLDQTGKDSLEHAIALFMQKI